MKCANAFNAAWAGHWSKPRFQKSGWAREVSRLWETYLAPSFGDRDLKAIGPKAVREWHASLEAVPVTANRALEVLSRVFSYAMAEELIPMGENPCKFVKAYPEKRRTRYASDDELARIGAQLKAHETTHPVEVAFCHLAALTGARPRSLMEARWDQLTVADGVGLLRFAGKSSHRTGEDETLVIPGPALKLLQALPRRPDGRILGRVAYRPFWANLQRKAGVSGLWLRDLRRTFATIGITQGVAMETVGELLNHRNFETTKRYAKVIPATQVKAASQIAARVEGLLSGR